MAKEQLHVSAGSPSKIGRTNEKTGAASMTSTASEPATSKKLVYFFVK